VIESEFHAAIIERPTSDASHFACAQPGNASCAIGVRASPRAPAGEQQADGILIQDRLNPVVVLLEKRPYLVLLLRGQLQVFRKASKFLIDRLRRVDVLKLLARRRLYRTALSRGDTGHSEHECHPACRRERPAYRHHCGFHTLVVAHAAERSRRPSREIRLFGSQPRAAHKGRCGGTPSAVE